MENPKQFETQNSDESPIFSILPPQRQHHNDNGDDSSQYSDFSSYYSDWSHSTSHNTVYSNATAAVEHNSNNNNEAMVIPTSTSAALSLIPTNLQTINFLSTDNNSTTAATTALTTSASTSSPSVLPEIDQNRQWLILALLEQVASLHDATPRTFALHVLHLLEKQILDPSTVRFLFDYHGLIPKQQQQQNHHTESSSSSNNNNNNNNKAAVALTLQQERDIQLGLLRQYFVAQPTSFPSSSSPDTNIFSLQNHPLISSRYQRDFQHISPIQSGSFGSVHHVKHKMDSEEYALKEIYFQNKGFEQHSVDLVLREVKCLAQLNHLHCVRYYTSWLEPMWNSNSFQRNHNNDYSPQTQTQTQTQTQQQSRKQMKKYEATGNHLLTLTNPQHQGITKLIETMQTQTQKHENLHISEEEEDDHDNDHNINDNDSHNFNNGNGFRTHQISSALERRTYSDEFNWYKPTQTQNSNQDFDADNSGPIYEEEDSISLGGYGDNDVSEYSEWSQDLDESTQQGSIRSIDSREDDGFEFSHLSQSSIHSKQQQQQQQQQYAPPRRSKSSKQQKSSTTFQYQICLYIQMELCHSTTLADWIHEQNHSTSCQKHSYKTRIHTALSIMKQLAGGLEHVHSKHIVHRDLKPANIFSCRHRPNHIFKIGDFGLSKTISPSTAPSSSSTNSYDYSQALDKHRQTKTKHTLGIGTASYTSPEQISSSNYGTPSDIYSLGLIFLEMIGHYQTAHERARAFHSIRRDRNVLFFHRKSNVKNEHNDDGDEDLKEDQHILKGLESLILDMTEEFPDRRPTANKVLEVVDREITRRNSSARRHDKSTTTTTTTTTTKTFHTNMGTSTDKNSHNIEKDCQNIVQNNRLETEIKMLNEKLNEKDEVIKKQHEKIQQMEEMIARLRAELEMKS